MNAKVIKQLLLAAVVIPLNNQADWKIEKYSNIKSNEISFSDIGMLVKISSSASPIVFKLESKVIVTDFKVRGEFHGLPQFKDVAKQGQINQDDYALRIGFIVPGEHRLNGLKKMLAASWVRHLYEQVPNGMGLDRVQFYDITQNREQVGKSRVHPLSDLIHEEFFDSVGKAGVFKFEYKLKQPIEAVAIWISIDGDDTQSEYSVLISSIELN